MESKPLTPNKPGTPTTNVDKNDKSLPKHLLDALKDKLNTKIVRK